MTKKIVAIIGESFDSQMVIPETDEKHLKYLRVNHKPKYKQNNLGKRT